MIPSSIVPFPLDIIVAVEEQRFQKMKEVLAITSIDAVMRLNNDFAQASPLEIKEGVGVITVDGPMTKNASFFQLLFGGASYTALREALAEAMGNDEVNTVLWLFDSPGGFADGLAEMGDAMLAAQGIKPMYAQVTGICASAAYYMACCTDSIFAQRMDLVGSIGVRSLWYDYSRMFAKEGIEAVVSDTGEYKSAGAMGTEITERQRDYFQSLVEVFNKDFLAVVARGRAMKPEKVAELADGRVYPAKEAATNGLIDGIQTFEQTLGEMQKGKEGTEGSRDRGTGGRRDGGTKRRRVNVILAPPGRVGVVQFRRQLQ